MRMGGRSEFMVVTIYGKSGFYKSIVAGLFTSQAVYPIQYQAALSAFIMRSSDSVYDATSSPLFFSTIIIHDYDGMSSRLIMRSIWTSYSSRRQNGRIIKHVRDDAGKIDNTYDSWLFDVNICAEASCRGAQKLI